jgi:hypothetical protein
VRAYNRRMSRPPALPEPRPGAGVDRTLIRRLLDLTPAERIHLLVEEARNMAEFDRALKR